MMEIRKYMNSIELVAEDMRETKLLQKLFQGVKGEHYRMSSFGYDRNMPKSCLPSLEWWAKRQVLVFSLEERLT